MTECPKTPRTPSKTRTSRKQAPRIPSPTDPVVSRTPTRTTRGNKTPTRTTRNEKENSAQCFNGSRPTAARAKDIKAEEKERPLVLKAQTSREIAELIALMRSIDRMQVIEIPSDIAVDRDLFENLMDENVPVVFRQHAGDWKCVTQWSDLKYLKRAAAEEEDELPHRKYRQFLARSSENGRLHLTDGKSKAKAVSIAEFLEHTSETEGRDGLYLLGIHAVGNHSPLSYCPVQPHAEDKEKLPPLSVDVPKQVDLLEWYAERLGRLQKSESPIRYDHQQFFLASGYAFTDLHYDSYDNFYVAVTGTRRWTLACPNASRWLIDATSGKLKSGSSAVPHQGVFAKGSPAQIYPFAVVDLMPGDVLFVPNCWWHLVESVPGTDGFSSAFNFFFSRPPEDVFGDFQAGLASTDSSVNELQAECRARIASAFRCKSETAVPAHLLKPPGNLHSSLWNQLTSLLAAHGVTEELEALHKLHERNSTNVWHKPSPKKASSVTNPDTSKALKKENPTR